jgi:hypothetical protein
MRFVLCGDFWFLRFLQPVRYAKNRNKNTVRFSKNWLEIPYGVCVYWWGKSQCGEVRRKAKSDQCLVLEGHDDFVLRYGREISKKMMGKPGT